MQTHISLKKRNENEQIFDIVFKEDEITWQTIIYDLIAREEMDPWNINISLLSQRFIEMLKKLKQLDFRITGKMVIAAALLLKIKSKKLLSEDIAAFDNLLNSTEEYDLLEELESMNAGDAQQAAEKPLLYPRIPQPRKRKVSVYDLISALEKALEVEDRRKRFLKPKDVVVVAPKKLKDISVVIEEVFQRVVAHFDTNETRLTFTDIIPSDSKHDKVLTFIPLLHLENARKVDLSQEDHFEEIYIELAQAAAK